MEKDTPVIPGLIAGFRIFRIDIDRNKKDESELILSSAYQVCRWNKGINNAKCLSRNFKSHGSTIPNKDCNCGLQAYYDFNPDIILEPKFFERFAIASVVGGGNVFLHNQGWRAEKAQVTGLFIPEYSNVVEKGFFEKSLAVQKEICEIYKVKLFSNYKKFKNNSQEGAISLADNKKLKPHLFNQIKKLTFGPISLNDEIDIHGGDCSLKIMSALNNKDYQFDTFPKTLLKRKRGVFLPSPWRLHHRDKSDSNTVFYRNSVGVISDKSSRRVMKFAKVLDSSKHHLVAIALVAILSVLFSLTDMIPQPLTIFILGLVFISVLFIAQKIRQRVRKKLIKSVNIKINSV